AAIAEVREEAWPDVRDADELADVLHTLIALPEDFYREAGPQSQSAEGTAGGQASYQGATPGTQASYQGTTLVVPSNSAELRALVPEGMPLTSATWLRFFEELRDSHRATRARVREESQAGAPALHNNCDFWVSAEKAKAFRSIYPNAQFEDQIPEIPGEVPAQEDALKAALTGWLTHLGPTTASNLAQLLRLPIAEIEKALLRIESTGLILRGNFEKLSNNEQQWCE